MPDIMPVFCLPLLIPSPQRNLVPVARAWNQFGFGYRALLEHLTRGFLCKPREQWIKMPPYPTPDQRSRVAERPKTISWPESLLLEALHPPLPDGT